MSNELEIWKAAAMSAKSECYRLEQELEAQKKLNDELLSLDDFSSSYTLKAERDALAAQVAELNEPRDMLSHRFNDVSIACKVSNSLNGKLTTERDALAAKAAALDALAAQVEVLKDAANFAYCNWRSSSDVIGGMRRLVDAVDSTPQQCLAEIRAEAVQCAVNNIASIDMSDLSRDFTDGYEYCRALIIQYAEQTRQGGE